MFATYPKLWSAIDVAVDSDIVLFAQPLPAEAIMHSADLDIRIIGSTSIGRTQAAMYGLHGYVIPVLDPDAGTTPDVIWDTQVPKDKVLAEDAVDMDTGASDTAVVDEPGLINIEGMLNIGDAPVQVFERQKFITWADQKGGYDHTADDFMPADVIRTKITKTIHVDVPSYFLLALSSPLTSFTSGGTWPVINTDAEWTQLQYMEYTLEDAWKALVGLTEAALDDPYVAAMTVIGQYLEHVHETSASMWDPQTWRAFGKASFHISVPGTFEQMALSGSPD